MISSSDKTHVAVFPPTKTDGDDRHDRPGHVWFHLGNQRCGQGKLGLAVCISGPACHGCGRAKASRRKACLSACSPAGHVLFGRSSRTGEDLDNKSSVPGRTGRLSAYPVYTGHAAGRYHRHRDLQPAGHLLRGEKGPILSPSSSADEINRAPAKVQSALLEAMQERQITIGEHTFVLPELFLSLPHKTLSNRKAPIPCPKPRLTASCSRSLSTIPPSKKSVASLTLPTITSSKRSHPVIAPQDILAARKVVSSIFMDDKIKDYIVALVYATRDPKAHGLDLKEYIETGASPRATINLKAVSKALAYLAGRGFVTPDDVNRLPLVSCATVSASAMRPRPRK